MCERDKYSDRESERDRIGKVKVKYSLQKRNIRIMLILTEREREKRNIRIMLILHYDVYQLFEECLTGNNILFSYYFQRGPILLERHFLYNIILKENCRW